MFHRPQIGEYKYENGFLKFGFDDPSGSFYAESTRMGKFGMKVTPAGVEPAIFWMRTKCPGPLDDGAMLMSWTTTSKYTSRLVPNAPVRGTYGAKMVSFDLTLDIF